MKVFYAKMSAWWWKWRHREIVNHIGVVVDSSIQTAIVRGEVLRAEAERDLRPKNWIGRLRWWWSGKCVGITVITEPGVFNEVIEYPRAYIEVV